MTTVVTVKREVEELKQRVRWKPKKVLHVYVSEKLSKDDSRIIKRKNGKVCVKVECVP